VNWTRVIRALAGTSNTMHPRPDWPAGIFSVAGNEVQPATSSRLDCYDFPAASTTVALFDGASE